MTYERMQPEDMNACIELTAKAFEHYDFFSVYIPYKRRMRLFLKSMLGVEFRVNRGLVHFFTARDNGRIAAVAILRDSGYKMPNEMQYLKAGFWKNCVIGGFRNVAAWFEMDQKAEAPCRELIAGKENAWYLHLLAVDTEKEGKGIGSRMLQECIIPYVRGHGGKTLCLYTNSEINCRFYEKNGFRQFNSTSFSYKGRSFGSWSYLIEL